MTNRTKFIYCVLFVAVLCLCFYYFNGIYRYLNTKYTDFFNFDIASGLGLIFFGYQILLQKQELKLQREEVAKQADETKRLADLTKQTAEANIFQQDLEFAKMVELKIFDLWRHYVGVS